MSDPARSLDREQRSAPQRDTFAPRHAPAGAPRSVGELVRSSDQASPDMLVATLFEVFQRRPELDAIALVRGGRPTGLVTRQALLLKLGRNFGYELFARRPATRIADLEPLVIDGTTSLEEAVERAFSRPPARAYDDLLVVDGDGLFVGLLSARDLAVEQGLALTRAVLEHESALERNRELEKVESIRAQFLAHATHELRSPVNAIVGLTEILGMACARGDVKAVHDRLELLQQTATGLRGTVNNILDLSKLEAGRTELHPETVQLLPLLEELAATTRVLVGARQVAVEVAVRDAPPEIVVDRQRLRQILVNLLSNAAKFTDAGRIELGAARGADGLRFWVQDSGCGIKQEDLDRLFVPFGQLEDARTKAHAGTGLGLVISRSLAQLLGGRIAVESRYGEGTRFTLHL
ncbi:MAG: ATP-binding protein [Anaeromyxobacteraceae bacterium]